MERPNSQIKCYDDQEELAPQGIKEIVANKEIKDGMSNAEENNDGETLKDLYDIIADYTWSPGSPSETDVFESITPTDLATLDYGLMNEPTTFKGHHGHATVENNQASTYQQQLFDSTSSANVPATANAGLPMSNPNYRASLTEQLGIKSNIPMGSATLGEDFMNERAAFKGHHGHETVGNNQASTYQQQLFDSTSSVNVPATADERLPMSNPNYRASLTEQLGIKSNIPMGSATLGEDFMNERAAFKGHHGHATVENNHASTYQQQRFDSTISVNVPATADERLPMSNPNYRASLTEQLGIKSNIPMGSETLGEDFMNERAAFKGHHGHETVGNNQASTYQQQLFDSTSSVNVPATADERLPMSNPNYRASLTEQLGIKSNIPMGSATLGEDFMNERAAFKGHHGHATVENNHASTYQQQRFDSTISVNVPATADERLPMSNPNYRASLTEQLGIKSNIPIGSATLGEYFMNERATFKGHHGHETVRDNQASTYQQQLFDSTSSVNVPATADERLPMSNPNYRASLTEQLGIKSNIPMGSATLEEGLLDYRLDIRGNNQASSNQQQCLGGSSRLNTTILSNEMLSKRNSDQVVGHTSILDHPMTNNGMHDGTANANFSMPFTDQQRIGSNENTQQHSVNLRHGNTSSLNLQMEYCKSTQGSYQDLQMDYNYESNRLKSFQFKTISASKTKLARYGFYFIQKYDHVKCFSCQVVVGNWSIGDDPHIEHFKHSPNCDFINFRLTANVPSDEEDLNKELPELIENMRIGFDSVPKHPDYKDAISRLESFKAWPAAMPIIKEELSQTGFFYLGCSDEVRCFHCGRFLHDWKKEDSPLEEHYRLFRDTCQFINDNYSILKSNARKRKRNNASNIQLDKMIEYIEGDPDLNNGTLYLTNKPRYDELWGELATKLNRLGPAEKTAEGWRKAYKDRKYNKTKRSRPNQTPQPEESVEPDIAEPQSIFPNIIIEGQQIGFQVIVCP